MRNLFHYRVDSFLMKIVPPQVYCQVYERPSGDKNFLTILNRGFIIQLFLITRLGKQS